MDRPTCETCPYFSQHVNDCDRGDCRRTGPLTVRIDGDEGVWFDGHWPEVSPDDWCGEHPGFPAFIESTRPAVHVTPLIATVVTCEMLSDTGSPLFARTLSVRARKTLKRLGPLPIDWLSREKILEIRHCGDTTADEILYYVKSRQ